LKYEIITTETQRTRRRSWDIFVLLAASEDNAVAIKVQCPECKKTFSAQDSYHHKMIKCPSCGSKFEAITVEEKEESARVAEQGIEKANRREQGAESEPGPGIVRKFFGLFGTAAKAIKQHVERARERRREFYATHFRCPSCGTWAEADSDFCYTCGRPFKDEKALPEFIQKERQVRAIQAQTKAAKASASASQVLTCGALSGIFVVVALIAIVAGIIILLLLI
jgi:DNA-directed RNA polymerase subunit RPC12/RpoP